MKGTQVKRKASNEEPAYIIEQKDDVQVVKSESKSKKGKRKN